MKIVFDKSEYHSVVLEVLTTEYGNTLSVAEYCIIVIGFLAAIPVEILFAPIQLLMCIKIVRG